MTMPLPRNLQGMLTQICIFKNKGYYCAHHRICVDLEWSFSSFVCVLFFPCLEPFVETPHEGEHCGHDEDRTD